MVPGSTLMYGSSFMDGDARPRLLSSRPREAAVMPFAQARHHPAGDKDVTWSTSAPSFHVYGAHRPAGSDHARGCPRHVYSRASRPPSQSCPQRPARLVATTTNGPITLRPRRKRKAGRQTWATAARRQGPSAAGGGRLNTRSCRHIRSGAVTPSIPKTRRRVSWVARQGEPGRLHLGRLAQNPVVRIEGVEATGQLHGVEGKRCGSLRSAARRTSAGKATRWRRRSCSLSLART